MTTGVDMQEITQDMDEQWSQLIEVGPGVTHDFITRAERAARADYRMLWLDDYKRELSDAHMNTEMREESDRERAYRLKQDAAREQANVQRERKAWAAAGERRGDQGAGLTTVAPTPRFGWLGGVL